jgi:hypothetical protein
MLCLACGEPADTSNRRRLIGKTAQSEQVFGVWKSLCSSKLVISEDEILKVATSPGIICRYVKINS